MRFPFLVTLLAGTAPVAAAQDWPNFGGGPTRSGQSSVVGPATATQAWSNTDDFSIISWQPVISDGKVFAMREAGFPSVSGPNDLLVAYDLDTGAELWTAVVPYANNPDNEWIAYVAGADGGRVYAARGGSGRSTPVYAFNAEDGMIDWISVHETLAGPQDGVVFTPEGDLIVGDETSLARIDATDGSTVWSITRSCSVSGNCGAVISATGAFIDEPSNDGVNIGQRITKINLATGARLYQSPLMVGFTVQNAPFLSPEGSRIYFARSQNNLTTDFLYAFQDTGSSMNSLWNRPIRWTTSHEHGIGLDGSIYAFLNDDQFVRLDPDTGDVMNSAGVLAPLGASLSPRTAIDADGKVYISNGWASTPATNGRVWAFLPDLSQMLFVINLDRQNSGGPALGSGGANPGTLVVADRQGIHAYRDNPSGCSAADLAEPYGVHDFFDVQAYLGYFSAGDPIADFTSDGTLDFFDVLTFLNAFTNGCP